MKAKITLLIALSVFLFISIKTDAQTVLYTEDFESGTAGWNLNATDLSAVGPTVTGDANQFIVNNIYAGGQFPTQFTFTPCGVLGPYIGIAPCPSQNVAVTGNPQSNFLHIYYNQMNPPFQPMYNGTPAYLSVCGLWGDNFAKMTTDINTTGRTGVELSFYWLCNPAGSKVYYSTDGGTNWFIPTGGTLPSQPTWTTTTITDPNFDNQATLRFGFMFNAAGSPINDPPFSIDQIVVSEPAGAPALITGITASSPVNCFGGADGMAHTSTSGGAPPYTFQWYSGTPPGTLLVGQTDSIANGLSNGDHYCVVSDGVNFDTSYVTISQPASAVVVDTLTVVDESCSGSADGSVTLGGSGGSGSGYTYSMDGVSYVASATFGSLSSVNNPHVGYTQDGSGCVDSIIFNINSGPPVIADTVSTTIEFCIGSADASVTLSGSGGSGTGFTYSVDGMNFVSGTTFNGLSSTNNPYYGYVMDSNGCLDSVLFNIAAGPSLVMNITDPDPTICEGDNYTFSYTFSAGTLDEYWTNDNSLTFNPDTTATAQPSSTTTYVGYVEDPNNGCQSNRDSITIVVGAGPAIGMDPDTVTIQSGESVTLDADVQISNVTFLWTNTSGDNLGVAEQLSVDPTTNTEYIIIVTNSTGCSSSDTALVIVEGGLEIFTAFTPNGDKDNDTWVIRGIERFPDATVRIFNRWGRTVFDQEGDYENNAWDGTNDGKDLPAAGYFYIINLNDDSSELTGTVTILR